MSNTLNLVRAALKDKNPSLYQELSKAGSLSTFLEERTDEIQDQITSLMMEIRAKGNWESLPLPELAANLKMAHAQATEIVLAEMLEFPQDETYPQSQGETTPSGITT